MDNSSRHQRQPLDLLPLTQMARIQPQKQENSITSTPRRFRWGFCFPHTSKPSAWLFVSSFARRLYRRNLRSIERNTRSIERKTCPIERNTRSIERKTRSIERKTRPIERCPRHVIFL